MVKNTKESIKFIVYVGAMSALAIALAFFVHFPIFPAVPFLEYDPADIVIYLTTMIFGIPAGLIATVIVAVLQGVSVSAASGAVGILMHIFGTGSYVISAGLVYKKWNSRVFSTIAGITVTTVAMIAWNLAVTPLFLGGTVEDVLAILVFIILFNIIKHGVNGIIAALIADPVSRMVKKI